MDATDRQDDHQVRCRRCQMKVQERDGDYLVVRNAIIRVDLRTALSYAKCPRCKAWNQVGLQLVKSAEG